MKRPRNGRWPLYNCRMDEQEPYWEEWERAEAWPFYIPDRETGFALEWDASCGMPVAGWFVSLYSDEIDEYERCTETLTREKADEIAAYFTFKIQEAHA